MSQNLERINSLFVPSDREFLFSDITKAGCIVFRDAKGGPEILLIHRKKQNDWSFPKGHVETGESLLEAGMRELEEETSIQPMVLGRLPDFCYSNVDEDTVRLAFFFGYADFEEAAQQVNKDGESAVWVPIFRVCETLSYGNLREYFTLYVSPLFSKQGGSPSIDIFFSSVEPYQNGVESLSKTLGAMKILNRCIEFNRISKSEKLDDVLFGYFLANHQYVHRISFWIECQEGRYVINGVFLRLQYTKSQVQEFLRQRKISVPPSIPYPLSQGDSTSSPLRKSERHSQRNLNILDEKITCDPWEVYLEQEVPSGDFVEQKLGYVAGKIFQESDDVRLPKKLLRNLYRIQSSLGLEVFSVDVFLGKNDEFFIVDVNPAPAFFHNKKARMEFGRYLQMLSRFFDKDF